VQVTIAGGLPASHAVQGGWDNPPTALPLANWLAVTGCDRSSWLYNTTEVPASSIFTNVATADLRPNVNHINQWLVNGKGLPFAQADIDGAARQAVFANSCDIGVKEINPVGPYANPPSVSVAITGTGVYNFVQGSRTLASINVTTQGTLTNMALQLYSQSYPVNSDVPGYTETRGDAYYKLTATATTINYIFDATFAYDSQVMLGPVTATDAIISHGQAICKTWSPYLQTNPGNPASVVNVSARTISVSGIRRDGNFAFTSNTTNILQHPFQKPVGTLTTASAVLNWSGENLNPFSAYTIQYRVLGGPSFLQITNVPACVVANCSYTLNGLAPNTTYEWRIRNNCFGTTGSLQTFTTPASKMDESSVATGLVVFPNPARDFVNIQLTDVTDNSLNIVVVDMMGREVVNTKVDTQDGTLQYTLPLADLTAGLYIVKVNGEAFSQTKNIVVTK